MGFQYHANIVRAAEGSNSPQFKQLSDSFPFLGNAWDLNVLTRMIHAVSGAGIESSGVEQAASTYHQLTMHRLMENSMNMLALTRGRGLFLFTLKPSSIRNHRWNQQQYLISARPYTLIKGCLEQMQDARMNHRKPLEALARTLITIGQLGPGGQIRASLEMRT